MHLSPLEFVLLWVLLTIVGNLAVYEMTWTRESLSPWSEYKAMLLSASIRDKVYALTPMSSGLALGLACSLLLLKLFPPTEEDRVRLKQ